LQNSVKIRLFLIKNFENRGGCFLDQQHIKDYPRPVQSTEKRSRTKIIGPIKQGDEIRKHRKRPLSSCILQSPGKDNGRSKFAAVKKKNKRKKKGKLPGRAK